jgi:hypothetical protein
MVDQNGHLNSNVKCGEQLCPQIGASSTYVVLCLCEHCMSLVDNNLAGLALQAIT